MAAEPGISVGAAGGRFFMAPPDFVGCGLDEFARSSLAAQAVVDEGLVDVVIAVLPFDKVF